MCVRECIVFPCAARLLRKKHLRSWPFCCNEMIEDPQILVCFEESLMVQVYCLAGTYSMTQGEGLDAQDKTTDCKV